MPDLLSSTNNIQVQRGVGTSTNGAGAFGAGINMQTNQLNEKAYAQIKIIVLVHPLLLKIPLLLVQVFNNHFTF